jgi:S-adenosylmethionine/arginine decarboxylase-like enzyme
MKYTRKHRPRIGSTRKSKQPSWGYHLIINAADCNPEAIRSKQTIAAFVKTLVSAIDMKAYGAPRIVRFGSGLQQGYTLVQLIETSNITAHFAEETNDIYFDVFSCKTFAPKAAIAVFKEYFQPSKLQVKFFPRQAPRH